MAFVTFHKINGSGIQERHFRWIRYAGIEIRIYGRVIGRSADCWEIVVFVIKYPQLIHNNLCINRPAAVIIVDRINLHSSFNQDPSSFFPVTDKVGGGLPKGNAPEEICILLVLLLEISFYRCIENTPHPFGIISMVGEMSGSLTSLPCSMILFNIFDHLSL